jgi:hypothetical protein
MLFFIGVKWNTGKRFAIGFAVSPRRFLRKLEGEVLKKVRATCQARHTVRRLQQREVLPECWNSLQNPRLTFSPKSEGLHKLYGNGIR